MTKTSMHQDETGRLISLHSLRILDTPAEERFDRITRLASRLFSVDIALISLIDANRQWFKSKQGLELCETSREVAFCSHTIMDEGALVIEDATKDPRFASNALVTGEPFIRFYAGFPVHNQDGNRIGTLCLIDGQPKSIVEADLEALKDLAAVVEDELSMSALLTVDELTRIANRRGFFTVANKMLSMCRRTGIDAELLYFDLDGLKAINDTQGHAAGDDILKCFAALLVNAFREADVVARLGGDEFVVLATAAKGYPEAAIARLDQAAALVPQRLAWSVGRATFDANRHAGIEQLVEEADSLMYKQKQDRQSSNGTN